VDTTTLIILGVLLLLGLYLFNRNRTPPRGTYDDKNYRSGGSIGGGPGAYDDPDYRSGGSIGGSQSSYDSPEHQSGGSIGGNRTTSTSRRPVADEAVDRSTERPRHDSPDFKSGGSIGGNASAPSRTNRPERGDESLEDDDLPRGDRPPRRK
jgi:hypothetical protein